MAYLRVSHSGGGVGVYVCGGIRGIGVGTLPIYEFFEPPIKPDAPMEHLPPPKNEAPPTEKWPSPHLLKNWAPFQEMIPWKNPNIENYRKYLCFVDKSKFEITR